MPNCFRLLDKQTGQAEKLAHVDDLICQHFGAIPDPVHYYLQWYDVIGLPLALGKSWDEIKTRVLDGVNDDRYRQIVDWLAERYTPDAWYQHK
jgi:hypothetical protein